MRLKDFNGDLGRTFQLAGDVAARLGHVFKNIFDGIKNIIKAAFPSGVRSGAGGVMLDWLDKITAGFKAFNGSDKFSQWLKNSTTNAVTALSTIGQFLKIFLDLAGNEQTKAFWMTLRQAVPYLKTLFTNGQSVGTLIATVLVQITRILSILGDANTLKTFFNTLTVAFKLFADILSNPAVQGLINFFGMLHGPILAIVLVVALVKKGFEIFLGYLQKSSAVVAGFTSRMVGGAHGMSAYRMEMEAANNQQIKFWQRVRESSSVAHDQRLLQMGRDAGFAADKLAKLELQMIANSRTTVKFDQATRVTTRTMKMNEAEAVSMAVHYSQLAKLSGMDAEQLKILDLAMLQNIIDSKSQEITNQELIASTSILTQKLAQEEAVAAAGGGAMGSLRVGSGRLLGGMRSALGGIGGGMGAMGAAGMGLSVLSMGMGMGTGNETLVGGALQGLGMVASMFGPEGMVIGGLMSIGGTIVNSIDAAEKARAAQIKSFNITSATMSVEHLNELTGFANSAYIKGVTKDKNLALATGSNISYEALSAIRGANIPSSAVVQTREQLASATEQYALNGKKSFNEITDATFRAKVQQAILNIGANVPGVSGDQIGSELGQLTSITSSNKNNVLSNITNLVSPDTLPKLKSLLSTAGSFNSKGAITDATVSKLLAMISGSYSSTPILLGGTNNPLGIVGPTSGTTSGPMRLPGIGMNGNGVTSPNYNPRAGGSSPLVVPYAGVPIYNGENAISPGRNNALIAGAPKLDEATKAALISVAGQLAGTKPTAISASGRSVTGLTNATDALNALSTFTYAISGVKNAGITRVDYGKLHVIDGRLYSDAQYNAMKQRDKNVSEDYSYKGVGYNIGGKIYDSNAIASIIKNIGIAGSDKLSSGGTLERFSNLTKLLGYTSTRNPIIEAGKTAITTDDISSFKSAGQSLKDAAAASGKVTASINDLSSNVASSTNKAIAFAIVAASSAGKTAIAEKNYTKINSLINSELRVLGLTP